MANVPAAVPGAINSLGVISVPFPMAVWFRPKIIKVHVFPDKFILTCLPAVLTMEPTMTDTVLKEGGNVKLN